MCGQPLIATDPAPPDRRARRRTQSRRHAPARLQVPLGAADVSGSTTDERPRRTPRKPGKSGLRGRGSSHPVEGRPHAQERGSNQDPLGPAREGAAGLPDRIAAVGLRPRRRVGGVVPDPDRPPLVRAAFERYATGDESDRSVAAAYCGYVSGLRDKSRTIRGRHEPIITEEMRRPPFRRRRGGSSPKPGWLG